MSKKIGKWRFVNNDKTNQECYHRMRKREKIKAFFGGGGCWCFINLESLIKGRLCYASCDAIHPCVELNFVKVAKLFG